MIREFPKFLAIMYAKTMISIRAVAKKLNDHGGHSTQKHRGRRDIFIYLRMFSVLSFNWIFGILTWVIPDPDPCDQDKGDLFKERHQFISQSFHDLQGYIFG